MIEEIFIEDEQRKKAQWQDAISPLAVRTGLPGFNFPFLYFTLTKHQDLKAKEDQKNVDGTDINEWSKRN